MKEDHPKTPKNHTPAEDKTTEASHSAPGEFQTIGNYKILRKIGEGGMGAVYEVEQEKPVRRKVALKLIKWGMDTKSVVARFESERQALALMNHPNIAKVYDAGSTDQGRPYFVMEYVQGIPITQYCDTHRLTTKERLNLFILVCEAVQHAHQKGIIHRDIKASNVLVAIQDDKAVPKIIDFGVAKATASRLTEHTVYTEFGQMIGTPEYMSPEQAEMTGLDIDTRTDVYSLGVLLYELLVGALPFDPQELRKAGFDEIRRKIREDEPSKPSTRVSTPGDESSVAAENRRTELPILRRQLKGDLDWITMKALEKDRTRRYQSALELAADINRNLNHEPVLACPPSTLYKTQKFVRRHKVGVTAGVIVSVALIIGIIGTTIGLVRATRAEAKAKEEAETAKEVSEFLVGLFEVSDPSEARGNTITAREILDKGAAEIEQELADQPLVQAKLMSTMGRVYKELGLYEQAHPLTEQALTIRQNLLGDEHADVARSLHDFGALLYKTAEYEEAWKLHEQALDIRMKVLKSDHPEVAQSLTELAEVLAIIGEYDKAQSLHEQALAIREKVFGPDHPEVASSIDCIARLLKLRGHYTQALELYKRGIAIREKSLGPDHLKVAISLNNFSNLQAELGNFDEAEAMLERVITIREKSLSPDHPTLAVTLNNLAILLKRKGDYKKAQQLLERALAIKEKALGPEHPSAATSMNNLANILRRTGDYERAMSLHERALSIREKALGPENPDVAQSLNNIAILLKQKGDYEKSLQLHERSLAIRENSLGSEHPIVAGSIFNIANLYTAMGDYKSALPRFERSLEISEKVLGSDHPNVALCLTGFAEMLMATGDYQKAQEFFECALAIRKKSLEANHPRLIQSFYNLACLLAIQGKREESIHYLKEALERGYSDSEILKNPALSSLYGDPDFEAIVAEVQKRMEKK